MRDLFTKVYSTISLVFLPPARRLDPSVLVRRWLEWVVELGEARTGHEDPCGSTQVAFSLLLLDLWEGGAPAVELTLIRRARTSRERRWRSGVAAPLAEEARSFGIICSDGFRVSKWHKRTQTRDPDRCGSLYIYIYTNHPEVHRISVQLNPAALNSTKKYT